jgi:hypothetical protein
METRPTGTPLFPVDRVSIPDIIILIKGFGYDKSSTRKNLAETEHIRNTPFVFRLGQVGK